MKKESIKSRAFHLRYLIDHLKNKKARKEVMAEYVSIIQQMSLSN